MAQGPRDRPEDPRCARDVLGRGRVRPLRRARRLRRERKRERRREERCCRCPRRGLDGAARRGDARDDGRRLQKGRELLRRLRASRSHGVDLGSLCADSRHRLQGLLRRRGGRCLPRRRGRRRRRARGRARPAARPARRPHRRRRPHRPLGQRPPQAHHPVHDRLTRARRPRYPGRGARLERRLLPLGVAAAVLRERGDGGLLSRSATLRSITATSTSATAGACASLP